MATIHVYIYVIVLLKILSNFNLSFFILINVSISFYFSAHKLRLMAPKRSHINGSRDQQDQENRQHSKKGMDHVKSTWYQSPRFNRGGLGLSTKGTHKPLKKTQFLKNKFEILSIRENTREERIKNATCYRCQDRGHFAWDCPLKKKKGKKTQSKTPSTKKPEKSVSRTPKPQTSFSADYLVVGTGHGSWDNIWYVNTSIPKHMTPKRDLFDYMRKCLVVEKKENCL